MSTVSMGHDIVRMADELARFSDIPNGLTVAYLTDAHRNVAHQLEVWMREAGLHVHRDAVGNVVGRLASGDNDAKTLITGSHFDTVQNGGRYDGRLGILLPIVVAKVLREEGVRLPFNLEVIGFAEEEGLRFKTSFLTSSPLAGHAKPDVLKQRDAEGTLLGDAMRSAGLAGTSESIAALKREPSTLAGFVEVHIEQGPVLLNRGLPVGVVTSIAGSVRMHVSVEGEAGHAGTTPMTMRRDAAAAAAEMILAVETRCKAAPTLVGTVGMLSVPGGAVNVIPGRCDFSLDIRAADDAKRDAAVTDVLAAFRGIAERRKVILSAQQTMSVPCAPCSPALSQRLADAVERRGIERFRLLSGAGHDAMMMANITDVAMLFVRCGNGGISHNPRETLAAEDADIAAHVFKDFLRSLTP